MSKTETTPPPQDLLTREEIELMRRYLRLDFVGKTLEVNKLCDMALAYLDLLRWKSEAMQVMNDLDIQDIGKEMELSLGDNIAVKILPYIKALKSKTPQGWQNIESAPRDTTPIIVYSPREADEPIVVAWFGNSWLARWDGRSVYDINDNGKKVMEPTHWQPLPSPPTLSAKDNKHEQ